MKQIKGHGLIKHYTNNTTTVTVINNDMKLNIHKKLKNYKRTGTRLLPACSIAAVAK